METETKPKKPILKKWWFWVLAFLGLIILNGILTQPKKLSIEEQAKLDREKATADSVAHVKYVIDSVRAVFVADSEHKAFLRLPKKEQARILKERKENEERAELRRNEDDARAAMQSILSDDEKKFHIKYIAQKYIETHLKNPDSFDEKSTSEPEIIVQEGVAAFRVLITYTTTNSFGATIQERKFVIVDKTGTSALLALSPQ